MPSFLAGKGEPFLLVPTKKVIPFPDGVLNNLTSFTTAFIPLEKETIAAILATSTSAALAADGTAPDSTPFLIFCTNLFSM